uniref:TolC family protein n=1 Tax=Alloprevotella sp. TaxID=1872471 RepID=UPI0040270EE1
MKHILPIIGCSVMLVGCSGIYKNYERPASLTQGMDSLYRNTTENVVNADTASYGNTPWQEVFTDPQLQAIINKALANNTNLLNADLSIQQIQAGLKMQRLAYYPSIAFQPQGTMSSWDFNKASKTYAFPIAASWQFASMGTIRNTKKQYEMNLEMTKAAKQAARTTIIANVANLYYTLQMLDEQLKTTQATINIWAENVRAMEAMKEGGMTNQAAVSQAKANYYNLQSTVPTLKNSITQTENALCTLMCEAPHSISRGTFNADNFPTSYSIGMPVQLMAHRPDVPAAEKQIASAVNNVNIAKAAFYPSLNITAQGSWTNNAGMIVNPGKILATLLGSISQPLFANGRLKANLKISQLQYEAAQNDFKSTLLSAGQEVSNALAQYQAAAQQEEACRHQVAELTTALENTKMLFQHSASTTYLETLTAQQSLIQAQLTLISDKFDKVQAAINLYQALGGGREVETNNNN